MQDLEEDTELRQRVALFKGAFERPPFHYEAPC
jgi:hypothetical protein